MVKVVVAVITLPLPKHPCVMALAWHTDAHHRHHPQDGKTMPPQCLRYAGAMRVY
jgi:hypothetical protein